MGAEVGEFRANEGSEVGDVKEHKGGEVDGWDGSEGMWE